MATTPGVAAAPAKSSSRIPSSSSSSSAAFADFKRVFTRRRRRRRGGIDLDALDRVSRRVRVRLGGGARGKVLPGGLFLFLGGSNVGSDATILKGDADRARRGRRRVTRDDTRGDHRRRLGRCDDEGTRGRLGRETETGEVGPDEEVGSVGNARIALTKKAVDPD